jgi:serralysin
VTLAELAATFPYEATFRGGVRVDAIDADFDGRADLITGAGPGRQPTVNVFSLVGSSLQRRQNYNAFDPTFLGGIFVG